MAGRTRRVARETMRRADRRQGEAAAHARTLVHASDMTPRVESRRCAIPQSDRRIVARGGYSSASVAGSTGRAARDDAGATAALRLAPGPSTTCCEIHRKTGGARKSDEYDADDHADVHREREVRTRPVPKMFMISVVENTVADVRIERTSISLIEMSMMRSSFLSLSFAWFSRIRSKMTTVSLTEKPIDGEEAGDRGQRDLGPGHREHADDHDRVVDASRTPRPARTGCRTGTRGTA